MNKLFLLVLFKLITGCIGYVNYQPQTDSIKNPNVFEKTLSGSSDNPISLEKLLKEWGTPSYTKNCGTHQEYVYKFSNECSGTVIFIIVPIPLMLPVSEKIITFRVEAGLVTEAVAISTGSKGTLVGCIIKKNYDSLYPGFGIDSDDEYKGGGKAGFEYPFAQNELK